MRSGSLNGDKKNDEFGAVDCSSFKVGEPDRRQLEGMRLQYAYAGGFPWIDKTVTSN